MARGRRTSLMGALAGVVIAAAGHGRRMHSDIPKQFLELRGKPMLIHCVSTFRKCESISRVVVVVNADRVESTRQMLLSYGLLDDGVRVVAGGTRRQDSVRNGLAEFGDDVDVVLVHDGARPLVSASLIDRCCEAVHAHGAAITAIPVKDTLKLQDDHQCIAKTIDRGGLWQAQTPQGARRELFVRAYETSGDGDVTDESSLFEKAGISVAIVAGDETNIKVTRPEDLVLAESMMGEKAGGFRIGHGFDAHRFAEGCTLVLGGVPVPHDLGLDGHSDADVVCHALCDAILGALGEGDLVRHFPDSNGAYKDISSLLLLDRVVDLASGKKFITANADLTIVCQAPKLSPYMEAMRKTLAVHCRVVPERINVKATTTEKMGYTGREEGIACHAVVLLCNR